MQKKQKQLSNYPVWFDGTNINEAAFCEEFLHTHKILFANNAFFTPEGRVTDDLPLRGEIFESLKHYAINNVPRKVTNILEVMKLAAYIEDFPPEANKIHLANGKIYIDGTFIPEKPDIVRMRLPVNYNPDTPEASTWLSFLDQLLYPEDIPTLQEFIGYCLIPSNKGQRMMIIKGNGGEGKSQIGAVLNSLLGSNMKDGSIGKISENRFARADLEHILLCVDDDMRMEALKQTSYVKSIVTAQGKMDLERKGKQSYQGWLFSRLLAFSNGDLQALYDRSDGFYRRQLVLTAKEKPADRVDDPYLAEKMKKEAESLLIDLELVGESSVAVEEVLLHRPLGQPIPIPELDGVVDVIQDRELGPLGVVEHFVVVGGVQPQILPTAHAGLAIQHLDTVEARLVEPLDLPQQVIRVRHHVPIVVEGTERLAAAALLQLHQGAQQILGQSEGTVDDRTGQERPVGISALIHHGDALVDVLGVEQVDVDIIDRVPVKHTLTSLSFFAVCLSL